MTDANKTSALPNAASTQKVDANGQSAASTAATAGAATTTAAKPKADAKPKAEKGEGRGRVSQYTGMLLKTDKTLNPRREGTHGHKSFGIILAAGKAGIVYEDYIKKGGRLNDLTWDINKDNVTAEKNKA